MNDEAERAGPDGHKAPPSDTFRQAYADVVMQLKQVVWHYMQWSWSWSPTIHSATVCVGCCHFLTCSGAKFPNQRKFQANLDTCCSHTAALREHMPHTMQYTHSELVTACRACQMSHAFQSKSQA